MSDLLVYKYAVIRIVPQVEREEFLNVGTVLYCRQQKFLQARYTLNEKRLKAFSATIDTREVTAYLIAFQQICEGNENAGPIGKLPIADRFQWLTATRSTILQTSTVHIGLCKDALETLEHLHSKLVL